MFYGILGIALYLVLLVVVGITCWRKGHRVLFVIGFFVPLLWLIGAVLRPRTA